MPHSRRDVIHLTTNAALGAVLFLKNAEFLRSYPLGLQPGLQLWSVKDDLAKNRDATLRRIAQIGYREVEIFELPPSPAEFRKKCADLGLTPISGHFYLQSLRNQKTIDAAKELGLQYIIVVFPTLRSMSDRDISNMSIAELNPLYEKISMDDYKWNAEQFNKLGETLKPQGIHLGYHNHAVDLKTFGGKHPYDLLIESTDPNLVTFQMDCGHMIHAGQDPIAYLKKYPTRITLLHLKDLKPGYTVSTSLDTEDKDTNAEIGSGVIDWKRLFETRKRGNIKHAFVEHEGVMDRPLIDAVAVSFQYLKQF